MGNQAMKNVSFYDIFKKVSDDTLKKVFTGSLPSMIPSGTRLTSLDGYEELYKHVIDEAIVAPADIVLSLSSPKVRLESLEGLPRKFVGDIEMQGDGVIWSLQGFPEIVEGDVMLANIPSLSLRGLKSDIYWGLRLDHVGVKESEIFQDCKISVGSSFYFFGDVGGQKSLSGIGKGLEFIKRHSPLNGVIRISPSMLNEHALAPLLVKGVNEIRNISGKNMNTPEMDILNRAIEQFDDPRKRVMWAQSELIKHLGERGKRMAKL
jgi:hypothetical protein